MNEFDWKTEAAAARVLRAADVMPPFNGAAPRLSNRSAEFEPASARSDRKEATSEQGKGRAHSLDFARGPKDDVAPPPADGAEIPKFDLAENILAEQRRVSARKRKGPGQSDDVPVETGGAGRKGSVGEPLPEEPAELQRIVAEIVARDIERLCKRSNRPLQR